MKSVRFAFPLLALPVCGVLSSGACSEPAEGLHPAAPANTTVKMDFFHKPLPDIALPIDLATRYDPSSPTGRRINASMVAPTGFEARIRERLDTMDGWGVLGPVVIPFTAPIDVNSVLERHDDADYDTSDDAVYVINITPDSPNYGDIQHLDIGNGNYPVVLERRELYWKNDPRSQSMSLLFEEADEDLNRNGKLDPGEDANGNGQLDAGEDLDGDGVLDPPEDTDADGLLDRPNYLPGANPASDDLAARADALMSFYERQSNTLIARPLVPFDDRTKYAVVVTRRILDANGDPVGSPYPYINHTGQTTALEPLLDVLPAGLSLDDIAFTYSFTTQTIRSDWQAVRDGLYGHGVQRHIGEEFPPVIDQLFPMREASAFPGMKKPHLMYGENWQPAAELIQRELNGADEGVFLTELINGITAVDYYSIGSYQSPQLFPRWKDEDNLEMIPLDEQVWPGDLASKPAPARAETVYFTAALPRKEVSARGEGKQVPIVIIGHGYTGNRFDVLSQGSYFARHGFAVLGIDGPSHGISLSKGDEVLAKALVADLGLNLDGALADRAFDQNADGRKDSGADFWTSYMFHTRDMVRQFAVDYMQLIRIVRTFDGVKTWDIDTNGDGQPDLAGDFDGDGNVDIGAESPIYFFGGSLGGIMGMVMGGVEPQITAIAPVSGGGGYADLGPRSTQSGVPEAFILRVMGPLFVGTIDEESGDFIVETVVSDLNDDNTLPLGRVSGVKPWDTMVVENMRIGEKRCAFVNEDGLARASNEANVGDPIEIRIYKGPQIMDGEHCTLREGVKPFAVIDSFGENIIFQGQEFLVGDPLVSLMEGLGMRRGHPDFRKLATLAQMILDPSDPAVLAQYWQKNPLTFPGTGETTGTHSLIITTMGDTAVPVSGGILVGRSSGIVPYLEADPRFGVPANQVYIDTYTTEGVHNLKRYTDPNGEGVHYDLENFSGGADLYGTDIPRADIPLRVGMEGTDLLGGMSAHIVPYTHPDGQHGFDLPFETADAAIKQCLEACTEMGDDPCGCSMTPAPWDVGSFMMNMVNRYFATKGQSLETDVCQSDNTCSYIPPVPAPRDLSTLE